MIGAFLMHSAMMRWSPWSARYQLPLFVVAGAFIAVVLAQMLPRRVLCVVLFLPLIVALPLALMNEARPLLRFHRPRLGILAMQRDQTYFLDRHQNKTDSFIAASKATASLRCRSFGLDAHLLHFDYPLFALVSEDRQPRTFSYAAVDNGTEKFRSAQTPPPCAVVCPACARSPQKWQLYEGQGFQGTVFDDVVVFHRPDDPIK